MLSFKNVLGFQTSRSIQCVTFVSNPTARCKRGPGRKVGTMLCHGRKVPTRASFDLLSVFVLSIVGVLFSMIKFDENLEKC